MERYIITPEAAKDIEAGLANGENWIVYNTVPYFLEKGDVFCFKDEYEAREFAQGNISDWDLMNVFYARSIGDVHTEITSLNKGKTVGESLNHSTLEKSCKENDLRQKSLTPAVESNQSEKKKKSHSSLLPKKNNKSKKRQHIS